MSTTLKFAASVGPAFAIGLGLSGAVDDLDGSDRLAGSDRTTQAGVSQDAPRPRPTAATEFNGRMSYAGGGSHRDDGATVWDYRVDEVDDPRLDGKVEVATRSTIIPGTGQRVWHGRIRIENDEGAWVQTPHLVIEYPGGYASTHTTAFVGEGAYEGLVAITEMVYRPERTEGTYDMRGYVFEGYLDDEPGWGIPPAPDAW